MSRRTRLVLFFVTGSALAAAFVIAALRLPPFGGARHPYRTHAVDAAVQHRTANVVASVNFDQRGLDTLGEETILLGSVMGVSVLLRPSKNEVEQEGSVSGRVLDSTALLGSVLVGVTALVGIDVVAHGQLTPGGGFQGGVVIGTALGLVYVAANFRAVERFGRKAVFESGESFGSAAFALLGAAGVGAAGAFLANFLPLGQFGELFSGGTVPVLNGVVGVEVAAGVMVLLTAFLVQTLVVKGDDGGEGGEPGGGEAGGAGS